MKKKKTKKPIEIDLKDLKRKEEARKSHCDSVIIHYIKYKKNFIYFGSEQSAVRHTNILKQYHEIIFRSKRDIAELAPSSFYTIQKVNNNYSFSQLQYPKNASTFENFNFHSFKRLFISHSIFTFCKYFNTNSFDIIPIKKTYNYSMEELIALLIQAKKDLETELPSTTIDFQNFQELKNAIENMNININRAQYDYVTLLTRKSYISETQYNAEMQAQTYELIKVIEHYNYSANDMVNEMLSLNIIVSLEMQTKKEKLKNPIDLVSIFSEINNNIPKSIGFLLENFDTDAIILLDEFKNKIIDSIKRQNYNLTEAGIFFPAHFYTNITNNESHLVEINMYKYHQPKAVLMENAHSFYKMFDELRIHSKEQKFLESDSINFTHEIAYFDPFLLLQERFYTSFSNFVEFIDPQYNNNANQNLIIYDFLQNLDLIQFEIIEVQQKSLFNELVMLEIEHDKNSKDISLIKSYIQNMYQDFVENEDQNDFNVSGNILILKIMLENIDKVSNYSLITIDDLGFADWEDQTLKNSAQNILSMILTNLNKNNLNSLKSLYVLFVNSLEDMFQEKNIKLKMEHKYFIRDLIKYMISSNTDEPLKSTTYVNDKLKEPYSFYSDRLTLLRKYMDTKISTIWQKL